MEVGLRVVTYNIHKGFSLGKLKFTLPQMRQALHDLDADILFLQEVQGEHKRREKRVHNWPDTSQFVYLAEQLWPHMTYGKNAIYQAGHHGNAILSKYPFIDSQNIDVSVHQRASRSLLHGTIALPSIDQHLHVICIHFGLFKQERSGQVERLVAHIAQQVPESAPLIIAGDFNDWRTSACEDMVAQLGLREVFRCQHGQYAKSFPALKPTLAVDRIYFRGLTVVDGICLNQKPWRLMSDHLPLMAVFDIYSTCRGPNRGM